MKIGVLTHPFLGNYGGMLQAYAMVKVLRNQGYDACNLAFLPVRPPHFLKNPVRNLRSNLRLGERLRSLLLWCKPAAANKKIPSLFFHRNGRCFQQHVPSLWIGDNPAEQLQQHGIEAVVVGSDQVWRDIYARPMKSLPFFFLDFATEAVRRQSIAYAASFGTDTWGGTDEETRICRKLIHDFKAISVREASGVDICNKVFAREALHVIDPTMLLKAEDYEQLITKKRHKAQRAPFVSFYLLDNSPATTAVVDAVSNAKRYDVCQLNASAQAEKRSNRFPISVSEWLRLIRDAEYFITDSFHGCVFAIIFNKPFVCLGNKNRGNARFDSLLNTFGLQDRLITNQDADTIVQTLTIPIDWERVNAIRHREQQRAFDFLLGTLKKD